jgi:hypothetical protein
MILFVRIIPLLVEELLLGKNGKWLQEEPPYICLDGETTKMECE